MFDRQALDATLLAAGGVAGAALAATHPSLFSAAELTISPAQATAMADVIAAIESVVALPAYRQQVLGADPASRAAGVRGVFYGYDFHLAESGPQLIEINTNAGGAMLNACLLAAHGRPAETQRLGEVFVAMFREEWRRVRGEQPLRCIAIVDENPADQYLAPEFALFRGLFARHGLAVVIADPAELQRDGNRLCHGDQVVDLIYNRLTDFALAEPAHAHLQAVCAAAGVVVTPHPQGHALYADKRQLVLLSDRQALTALGVPAATQAILLAAIPRTVAVTADAADAFWAGRKQWFFKPAAGFGSRAAYRGDKLTRRVFEEILLGGYIAQRIVPPSELCVTVDGAEQSMKLDVRCYVYDAAVQLMAARLYQGQTTNFRTPGGGFAPVFIAAETGT